MDDFLRVICGFGLAAKLCLDSLLRMGYTQILTVEEFLTKDTSGNGLCRNARNGRSSAFGYAFFVP